MHEMHEYNVQMQLHRHSHITFCKMLSLQRGAEKLGTGALTKLYQEEEQKAKSVILIYFWQINHQPIKTQLTKISFWSELSDLGSSSMTCFPQRAAWAEGGVLIL